MVPMSLRREASERAYQKAKKNGETRDLKDVPSIKEFRHWRIINNDFGWDIAFKESHMLIPKRVVSTWQYLDEDEIDELWFLISDIESEGYYDCIALNPPKRRSKPNHFHLHLLVYHEDRSKMEV